MQNEILQHPISRDSMEICRTTEATTIDVVAKSCSILAIEDDNYDYYPNRLRDHPASRWDDPVSKFTWANFGQRWQDVPFNAFHGGFKKMSVKH